MLLFLSCKSQQYTLDTLPNTQLIFGKGGGITGVIDTYTLLENGQLFYENSLSEEKKELKRISKKNVKILFDQLDNINLKDVDFNHPGNMYYFMKEVKGGYSHKVVWGKSDVQIDASIINLYEKLKAQLK
ncbi:hypothetical protein [Cellulophaga tyrosinoxydans]|nr:hypothetical protein [Cellulophaga tyrosinoxydans]